MLALMGLSIVSGAVSTLGASFFLLNASIVFFSKVLFAVCQLPVVHWAGRGCCGAFALTLQLCLCRVWAPRRWRAVWHCHLLHHLAGCGTSP